MAQERVVTFTTDFGTTDHFVGTMKGVVLNANPSTQVVDICNSVQSYDILDGALTIAQAFSYFPPGTIHVVIVDPGVGSARRPILATTEKYTFVAPDNGVLSLVYERESRLSVRHISAEHYFLQPVSQTFHGRDIFAAVAGALSRGVEPAKFGDEITDFVRFTAPKPKVADARQMKGVILKVDKFGNLVTNLTPTDVPQLFENAAPTFTIVCGKGEITTLRTAYALGKPNEVFAILGSMGFIELAANRGAAAQLLGATRGTEVTITVA